MNTINTTFGYFRNWGDVFAASMQNLGVKIASIIPEIVGALIILLLGLLAASILRRVVEKIIEYTRFEDLMKNLGAEGELRKIGLKIKFSKLIGLTVKWFIIFATLIAIADILNIPQITQFLESVTLYIPNILVALIILAIGIVASKLIYNLVKGGFEMVKFSTYTADMLANLGKWAIIIFSVMAALVQLKIAEDLIIILFTGLVFMFSLAGGLAFGLGGKNKAGEVLDRISGGEKK